MHTPSRREFLAGTVAGLCAGVGAASGRRIAMAQPQGAGRKLNVLHIMSDDLCTRLGCYGDPLVQSPQIDRLAARGVLFERAYCQYPLCNPSRASYMTGLRPDTTRVHENQTHFREAVPEAITLPQSFQRAGYWVGRVGKIYHYGVPRQIGEDGLDDPVSWEKVVNPRGRDVDDIGVVEVLQMGANGRAEAVTGKELGDTGGTLSWLAAEGEDGEQTDGIGATEAIRLLEERAATDQPFYLGVGFYRPHTPFVAPKAYFGQYPRESVPVAEIPDDLQKLFPQPALASQRPAELAMAESLKRQAIQAYYASTTFMDAQVGRLLDAVERLGLAENTVIVFQSDHGYHLGEKNLWQKMSLFEESTRVPLIVSVPGNPANGQRATRPVELVSLHKTLTDLCGIPAAPNAQGHSLRPLLEDPAAPWEHPAFSQLSRRARPAQGIEEIVGRSVRTERCRYTEWDTGRAGVELYDQEADPGEMRNLAGHPEHAETIAHLQAVLRAGGK